MAGWCGMSEATLRTALDEYLAVRRALGFKLARDGLLLEQFVGICEQAGATRVTSELATAWVTAPEKASASWLAMRLTVVRGFARWLQASDPAGQVPPLGWLPPRRRTTPYLYSDAEITALMSAARRARWPPSAATYETLIGLIAVTGMRVGEAIRLDRHDVTLPDRLITIRDSKLGKSRVLVIHPSTVTVLRAYLRHRAALSPTPGEAAFFVHPAGNRITYASVQQMFRTLTQRAGLTPRSQSCRPTIHGLRHTFAVNTLLDWHRAGVDVQARLPQLSTWLGHADPKWTYWYLSASPELLGLAGERLQAHLGRRP
jgi:integrase/recombinase XerD